ncbi:hypothetical protein F5Y00DRAFT_269732 [Daldinia vernicosa]|uniref:uncharacterized protein n=1 Tax=Daldinia vernicosa TaxID=114800 RepID=UPI002008A132|nr:uncharacterized protein F5Y00DRAFT_269732 [Daldinia vernicosa]KAI0849107.1 hypothetical protein F5Y00DRAFT_269732 [Daldinia vernicosa]
MEWAKQTYNEQYEAWMPWIEDNFLKYFTKDNKASYATKGEYLFHLYPLHMVGFIPNSLLPFQKIGLGLTKAYLPIEQLDKAKVTNIDQVNTLQDSVHGTVAGQVGQGGLLQPVGDLVSKEGVNRAERGGKDEQGGILPSAIPGIPGLTK